MIVVIGLDGKIRKLYLKGGVLEAAVSTVDWGDIGGTLSNQTDLQNALDAKANDSAVVHNTGNESVDGVKTFTSDLIIPDEAYGSGWNGLLEPPTKNAVYDKIQSLARYPMTVQGVAANLTNTVTYYWGNLPRVPQAAISDRNRVYVNYDGIINLIDIILFSTTAGTNEDMSLYLRLNDTTDYLIATVGAATRDRRFRNTAMNLAVVDGDYYEIKLPGLTWATPPLGSSLFGTVWVDYSV